MLLLLLLRLDVYKATKVDDQQIRCNHQHYDDDDDDDDDDDV